jgi:hypothetical protein
MKKDIIERLIKEYDEKLIELDKRLDNLSVGTNAQSYKCGYLQGKRDAIFSLLGDIKNLPNESKTVNRNENAEQRCNFDGDKCPYITDTFSCSDCTQYWE